VGGGRRDRFYELGDHIRDFDYFVHLLPDLRQFPESTRVRAGDDKSTPAQRGQLTEVPKQVPIARVWRRDVVDDRPRLMLLDERFEVHFAGAD
jgi:hypothetical protein